MTSPDVGDFDPGQHLSVSDVTVDEVTNPKVVTGRIKQSKTDPFRQGVSIFLSKTDLPLCPVAALLAYLAVRGNGDGPLFLSRGQPLTRAQLVSVLRKALTLAGENSEKYAWHSFRIGAARTVAACGIPIAVIKTLGRWKSQAHQLYIRIPETQLASISRSLGSEGGDWGAVLFSSGRWRVTGCFVNCAVYDIDVYSLII